MMAPVRRRLWRSETTQAVAFGPPVTPTPQVTIGGASSVVFAQIATGGPGPLKLRSATLRRDSNIRIDFFGPDGLSTGSLTDIVIPSRGVFFFSTDSQAQALNR